MTKHVSKIDLFAKKLYFKHNIFNKILMMTTASTALSLRSSLKVNI